MPGAAGTKIKCPGAFQNDLVAVLLGGPAPKRNAEKWVQSPNFSHFGPSNDQVHDDQYFPTVPYFM